MTTKAKYVLFFILSLVIPVIILILGYFFSVAVAKDKAAVFPMLNILCSLLFFIGGFAANFWYAGKLQISMPSRILAGLFSGFGFIFLLGFDKNLIPVARIIRDSFNTAWANRRILWPYILSFLLPTIALQAVAVIKYYVLGADNSGGALSATIAMLVSVASIIFTLWVTIALATVIRALLKKEQPLGWADTMSGTSKYLGPVIWTSILVGLVVFGGVILLIIPAIIFSVWYSFTFYAVVFEEKRGLAAMAASKELVVGRWWPIAWRVLMPGLFFSAVILLIQKLLSLPLEFFLGNYEDASALIWGALSAILNSLAAPLAAASTLLLYLNVKEQPAVQVKNDIASPGSF